MLSVCCCCSSGVACCISGSQECAAWPLTSLGSVVSVVLSLVFFVSGDCFCWSDCDDVVFSSFWVFVASSFVVIVVFVVESVGGCAA